MNILIVGAGGREHSMAWKCTQSPRVKNIFVTPGNGGIEQIAECWGTTDHQEIIARAKEQKIDLVLIGQDDYLVDGLTDEMEAEGFKVFGPSKVAAQLEGSKSFSKDFMSRQNIPTAAHQTFYDKESAETWLQDKEAPYVIKADGLAAGKGVIICQTMEEASDALDKIMVQKAFGESGDKVVIEEFLKGEEASFFVFTDGNSFVPMPTLQDHKPQLELDQGPNTGGMGCYSPAPVVTDSVAEQVIERVVKPAVNGMKAEGNPYKGVLYIGLMIYENQAKVVEFNARFGDPECQVLMMLLDSDLIDVAEAVADEKLDQIQVHWKDQAGAIVILASGGYPESYEKGFTIQGLEEVESSQQQMVFHAGTKRDQNRFLTAGGRVLGVTCLGSGLQDALKLSYENAAKINWPGMQFRRDIGLKGLKRMNTPKKGPVQVGIIMGSASDKKVSDKATAVFEKYGVGYEVIVSSAHRTPERTHNYLIDAQKRGVEVFIAMAGMAAHLPGVVAAYSQVPVIGVPVKSTFDGLDALYSIVQMPPGIPVATVGVDRGDNAAILALQILGLKYPEFQACHQELRLEMEKKVIASQEEVE